METQHEISDENLSSVAVLEALNAYAVGAMSRSVVMQRLGLTLYGDLLDVMNAAGVRIVLDEETQQVMRDSINRVFDGAYGPAPSC